MEEKSENENSIPTGEESMGSHEPISETLSQGEDGGEERDTIRRELDSKIDEVKTLNDKYLRLAAEFDNYKRRARRDQTDGIRFANEKILKDLLPIIDNLERAIQCGSEQTGNGGLLEGVELTYKQFLETLSKFGVRQISSEGELFDPAMHQAVAQVDSDTAKPNTVVEEFQKGYFLHERILRPAMVTVAKDKPAEDASSSSD
ncbi:MAG: nucleotide exchange factor GrpE [Nitrospirales bacterium]|nr:nucleotide exchange factor GrpE [Nitrospirales bacterium]